MNEPQKSFSESAVRSDYLRAGRGAARIACACLLVVGLTRCSPASFRAEASTPPTPSGSQEHVSASEARATTEIEELLSASVLKQYHDGQRPAQRDAHAKAQGCVKAAFHTSKSIPGQLRRGIFAKSKSYIAWIRFSNAVGRDDHIGLARGMAIKLTGAPGRKVLPAEALATTQDFLLVNYPIFAVRDPSDYVDFLRESQTGPPLKFFAKHPNAARITGEIGAQRVSNPLDQRYFSMTPYLLGPRYVKYSAEPVSCTTGARLRDDGTGPLPSGPNYLRAAMTATLASGASCFTFLVQSQTDPQTMPVEDSTVLWNEAQAPFVEVATIKIPRQRFDSTAQEKFCENLSYTPWHSLPENRPAGNINRIRRVVYDAISRLRHRLNDVPRREPTGREHFPGTPTLSELTTP